METLMRARHVTRLATAIMVVLIGLSGCSWGDDKPERRGAGGSSAADSKSPQGPSGDTGNLEDPQGAISALTEFSCRPDRAGKWRASGTLTNTGKATVYYLVSATVIESKTYSVLGRQDETLKLPAGAEREFALHRVFRGRGGDRLDCIPRVVSGS